ncbi:MAG: oligosaccharide flippase family protein [Bacteroidales bacterium]|nr:oligosaccharide flippase family protein [Bacteroidales bacterium]
MKASGNKENTYRNMLKGISIFGGVKIFEILINLIRGKFVAIFLGPNGMGASSIFTNVATTLTNLSSFGLNLAIVKEVSSAKEDDGKLTEVITVAKRLFYGTALTGALICILFSVLISQLSFGSSAYTLQFILLALAVFLMVVNAGKLSILQGMHEVKRLSRSSLIGSLAGLIFGIPLYYFFGTQGIVPAIVMLALTLNIFYSLNLRAATHELPKTNFSWNSHNALVKKLFLLGFVLMASDIIGNICNYLLLIFIRKIGNMEDVGFFQAANSITNQMAGVVFTALALDYFPRLSEAASDLRKMSGIINRQSEIITLIILPISLLIILFAPLIVRVLLTDKFEVIIPLLRWMALGVALKAMTYPMGYITFAKDNKKLFFWLEGVVGNILFLVAPLLFFFKFGLIGFGYGMVVEHLLCLIIYWTVSRKLYNYTPAKNVIILFAATTAIISLALILTYTRDTMLANWSVGSITCIFLIICAIQLRKLIRKDRTQANNDK